MSSNAHLLIKLRHINFLSAVVERIHNNLNKKLINFIKKLFDLLLIFVVFVQNEEAGTGWGLHAGYV